MLKRHWIPLGLVLLTSVCFGHVVLNDFIHFDDPLYITDNVHVLKGLNRENVTWAFGESVHLAGYWVPLTWLSLQLDASLFGPDGAWGFHLTNLLFHQANVVLFYFVLRRMTADTLRSAMAAAVFAVHPLRVESVAWVTERKDVLSTLFLILTVSAYHYYAQKPTYLRYGLVFLCFFIGLATKPTLVTLPFALLLLDYWPLGRLRMGQVLPQSTALDVKSSWLFLIVEKIPWIVTAIIFSVVTMKYASSVGAVSSEVRFEHRVTVTLSGYLGYVQNTLWPTELALLYPYYLPGMGRVFLAVATLMAITSLGLWLGRSQPAVVVGWFWFLGTMFPVSGFVQVGPQALADRYTYVPHLGLVITIVWGISAILDKQKLTAKAQIVLSTLVLTVLSTLTWIQVWYWRDSETLFTHTLSIAPRNSEMRRGLSGYWMKLGNLDLAEEQIALAVGIAPNSFINRIDHGSLMVAQGKHEEAELQCREALRIKPMEPTAHYLLGVTFAKRGRWQEAERAFQTSLECWAGNHGSRATKHERSQPHLFLGEIRLREGFPERALEQIEQAIEFDARLADAQLFRGIALGRMKRWSEAEISIAKAVELDAKDATSQAYLGFVLARQQKDDASKRAYSGLVTRFPNWLAKADENAMRLITEPRFLDQRMAEELATQLCEATRFRDPRRLNTLAAVQAAGREFGKAQATAKSALLLTSDPTLSRQLQERLSLYEREQALPLNKDEHKHK